MPEVSTDISTDFLSAGGKREVGKVNVLSRSGSVVLPGGERRSEGEEMRAPSHCEPEALLKPFKLLPFATARPSSGVSKLNDGCGSFSGADALHVMGDGIKDLALTEDDAGRSLLPVLVFDGDSKGALAGSDLEDD